MAEPAPPRRALLPLALLLPAAGVALAGLRAALAGAPSEAARFALFALALLLAAAEGLRLRPRAEVRFADAAALVALFRILQVRLGGLLFERLSLSEIAAGAGSFAAAALLVGLLVLRYLGRRPAGAEPAGPARQAALGLGLGLLSAGLLWLWLRLAPSAGPALPGGAEEALLALLVLGLTPLWEELLFRGLLYRSLREGLGGGRGGRLLAGVFGAALFAAMHGGSFGPIFALGLAATLAYERGGGLFAPVLVHLLHNGAAWLLEWL